MFGVGCCPVLKRELERVHASRTFTSEEKEWVNTHRRNFEIEEKELTIKYMKAELDYLEKHG